MSKETNFEPADGVTLDEVKSRLADRAVEFCEWLFPAGRVHGGEFCVGGLDGAQAGRGKKGSLKVVVSGQRIGLWKDWATDESGSNLLDLLHQKRADGNFGQAVQEAREWLGLPVGGASVQSSKRNRRKKAPIRTARKREVRKAEILVSGPAAAGVNWESAPRTVKDHTMESVYSYRKPTGEIAHQTIRYSPKTFRQRRPLVEGEVLRPMGGSDQPAYEHEGWVYSLEGIEMFPFRLPELLARRSEVIWLCEGEKDVEALESLGLLATTLAMGTGKWRPEYAQWFEDRHVVLVEDHDVANAKTGKRAGAEGVRKLAEELAGLAWRLNVLHLPDAWPGCAEGTDVSDFVAHWRGYEVTNEEMVDDLQRAAFAREVPAEILFGDHILVPRGEESVILLEDEVANRLVNQQQLLHAGGFWRWKTEGVWGRVDQDEWVHDRVRDVLRKDDRTLPLITSARIGSIGTLMRSSRFADPLEMGNGDPFLINVQNGMLHAETGEMFPHDPQLLSTTQIPIWYSPGAECPEWEAWMAERQPDEEVRGQLQELAGYCLCTALNFQKFFFLRGEGGTGKSTYMDILEALVGSENVMGVQPENLDDPNLRADMDGKRLYYCGEAGPKSFKHVQLIKQMSSREPVNCRAIYKPGFTSRNWGRFIMTSNHYAFTNDTTEGFGRRFIEIHWNVPISKRVYGFEQKLLAELPGIFNWALVGFRRLQERGDFLETAQNLAAKDELMNHRASTRQFLADRDWIDFDPWEEKSGGLNMNELYALYVEWCEDRGVSPFTDSPNGFSREVKRTDYERLYQTRARACRRMEDGVRTTVFRGVLSRKSL